MKTNRIFWSAGVLVVVVVAGLGYRVLSLSRQLGEKDRAVLLLSAALRRNSTPSEGIQADLSSEGGQLFSLRIRLRTKEKEIEYLKDALLQKEAELDSVRNEASGKIGVVRSLRDDLAGAREKMARLLNEKKGLEKQLASVKTAAEEGLKEKEKEIVSLRKEGESLKETLEGLRQSVEILQTQKKKLASPRLPREAREKIKEFGSK